MLRSFPAFVGATPLTRRATAASTASRLLLAASHAAIAAVDGAGAAGQCSVRLCGGVGGLAHGLGVSISDLTRWLEERELPPVGVYLRALNLVAGARNYGPLKLDQP
jgi:hypothetical protein